MLYCDLEFTDEDIQAAIVEHRLLKSMGELPPGHCGSIAGQVTDLLTHEFDKGGTDVRWNRLRDRVSQILWEARQRRRACQNA